MLARCNGDSNRGDHMRAFFWLIIGIGAGLFGLRLVAFIVVERAPNQAAIAALSCAFAVLPYCFASALKAIRISHTCPDCLEPIPSGVLECPHCRPDRQVG